MIRLHLPLAEKADWLRLFDPRGGGLFVPTVNPPPVGEEVRVDLTITSGGPRVILKGNVMWRRLEPDGRSPAGCSIGLSMDDREKINFLNGFVRGGLINRRERRRLPLRLPVTYGGLEGPIKSFTRDINDDGVFVVGESPLPEGTVIHMVVSVPGRTSPLQLKGIVGHTVIPEDEDVPGMGIRFELSNDERQDLTALVDELERSFLAGTLPEDVIT
jgi:Tfp pilus assembly protein PilZ